MFASFPEYEFKVPVELGPPGRQQWRAMVMSLSAGWFAMTIRERHGDELQSTMLFAWDSDVVDALEMPDYDVESLILFFPNSGDSARGFSSVSVKEVWQAINQEVGDEPCVLFVDTHGERRSGPFLEPTSRAMRTELIACIRD